MKIDDSVFVGGGYQKNSSIIFQYSSAHGFAIFQYSIKENSWKVLPPCRVYQQGLATINGELISLGGILSWRATNVVYTFRDGAWVENLPPMPTARYLLSTVSHNDELIVAAGGTTGIKNHGEVLRTDSVEVAIHYR